MTKHIIPAEPGFIALRYWDWDYVQHLPVIAWIINPDLIGKCVPLPVTVDGVFSGKNCAVKQPNGDIICGGFGEWEDYELWVKHMEKNIVPGLKIAPDGITVGRTRRIPS